MMKAIPLLLGALAACLVPAAVGDYQVSLSSDGAAGIERRPGDSFPLSVSLQPASGTDTRHDAIVIRLLFSEPGMILQFYDWSPPYQNNSADDDSHPQPSQLPIAVTANTLAGIGFPDNRIDIQLGNLVPEDGVTFGAGEVVRLGLRVPDNQPFGDFQISFDSVRAQRGFDLVPVDYGIPFTVSIVPEPATWMLGLTGLAAIAAQRRAVRRGLSRAAPRAGAETPDFRFE
jgi:hypothetical protein